MLEETRHAPGERRSGSWLVGVKRWAPSGVRIPLMASRAVFRLTSHLNAPKDRSVPSNRIDTGTEGDQTY